MIGYSRRQFLAVTAAALACSSRAIAQPCVDAARRLPAAAEAQIGVTKIYDPSYVRLPFPNGDVPSDRGVCTDVVIRAYRTAFGYDLQAQVHADMQRSFETYPRRWGLHAPDPNIDHRRVPNLQVFLRRKGAERAKPSSYAEWRPGDLVTQTVSEKLPHIGIISAKRCADGQRPLVVHNIGRGTVLEDILAAYPVTGRYTFCPI